jgi:hypothetical protein
MADQRIDLVPMRAAGRSSTKTATRKASSRPSKKRSAPPRICALVRRLGGRHSLPRRPDPGFRHDGPRSRGPWSRHGPLDPQAPRGTAFPPGASAPGPRRRAKRVAGNGTQTRASGARTPKRAAQQSRSSPAHHPQRRPTERLLSATRHRAVLTGHPAPCEAAGRGKVGAFGRGSAYETARSVVVFE